MFNYLFTIFLISNIIVTIFHPITKSPQWRQNTVFGLYCTLLNIILLLYSLENRDDKIIGAMYSAIFYVIVSLQPIIYSYIGYTRYGDYGFAKLLSFNILLFFINMVEINMKLILRTSSIYECSIHTYIKTGQNGYYDWKFSVCNMGGYSIFDVLNIIMSGIAFIMYDKDLMCIWKGLAVSTLFTMLIFSPSEQEFMLMFSASYIFANIYVVFKIQCNEKIE